MNKFKDITSSFCFDGEVSDVKSIGHGFINDTYIVTLKGGGNRYILQRKNRDIFVDIPAMMDNIYRVSQHVKNKVIAAGGNPNREALTIIPTKDGKLYHLDSQGDYWASVLFIESTVAYDAANEPYISYQGGKGIGMFQRMLCDFEGELADILPGFHNMRFRFEQWDKAVLEDKAGRVSSLAKEIGWIESRRNEMMEFYELIESRAIPLRVSHNDTKINNILFSKNGDVVCVIDLDTVLSSTCLNDFGDAIRTYANTGKEDDINLERVSLSLEMFKSFTEGYLSEAASFLTDLEKEYLAFSAKFIIYEQVLRFLMDYINGDTYYKITTPVHNLVRTYAQYKLLCSAEENYSKMQEIVKSILG